jgi:hypothetical protein
VAGKDWLDRKIDYYTQGWLAEPIGRQYVAAAEESLARVQALCSGTPISGALSEAAAVSTQRREKGSLHRGWSSHHRGRRRLLPRSGRPERTDHCHGPRNIRTRLLARRADTRLDRATPARPVPPDLEALAALGEDPDRRSLDCAAGDGVGMASIALFESSVLAA